MKLKDKINKDWEECDVNAFHKFACDVQLGRQLPCLLYTLFESAAFVLLLHSPLLTTSKFTPHVYIPPLLPLITLDPCEAEPQRADRSRSRLGPKKRWRHTLSMACQYHFVVAIIRGLRVTPLYYHCKHHGRVCIRQNLCGPLRS